MNTQTIERYCGRCPSLTYFFPNSPTSPTGAIEYGRDVDYFRSCGARIAFQKFTTVGCSNNFADTYFFSSTSPAYTPIPDDHPVINVSWTQIVDSFDGSGPVVEALVNPCQYIHSNFYLCSVLDDALSTVICSPDQIQFHINCLGKFSLSTVQEYKEIYGISASNQFMYFKDKIQGLFTLNDPTMSGKVNCQISGYSIFTDPAGTIPLTVHPVLTLHDDSDIDNARIEIDTTTFQDPQVVYVKAKGQAQVNSDILKLIIYFCNEQITFSGSIEKTYMEGSGFQSITEAEYTALLSQDSQYCQVTIQSVYMLSTGIPHAAVQIVGNSVQIDTSNPEYLEMIMKVTTSSGNQGLMPLKIAICGYNLKSNNVSPSISVQSLVGAIGIMAEYKFNNFEPLTSMCLTVTGYELTSVNPTGSLTLKDTSVCMSDDCRTILIDTSSSDVSEGDLQINVFAPIDPQLKGTLTPYITYVSASSLTIPTDKFSFPKFVCSLVGVDVAYHSLSSSNLLVDPAVSGIIGGLIDQTNSFELQIDTSAIRIAPTAIEFYIYGRTDIVMPMDKSYYAYSNKVTIEVRCGFEKITLQQPKFKLRAISNYAVSSVISESITFITEQINNLFQTDITICPITKFQGFLEFGLTNQIQTDISYPQLLNPQDISLTQLKFDTTKPFYGKIFLQGSSNGGKYAILELQACVCGFESIIVADQGQEFVQVEYTNSIQGQYDMSTWFSLDVGDKSSNECSIFDYKLYRNDCVTPDPSITSIFWIQGNNLMFERTLQYPKEICVEICGSEVVVMENGQKGEKIEVIKEKQQIIQEIKFEEYSKNYISTSKLCSEMVAELVQMLPDGTYLPFSHPQINFNSETQSILLDQSIPNTINLIIKLTTKGTVNYHSQQSIQSILKSAFQKMQIHICGNEQITTKDKQSSSEIEMGVNQKEMLIPLQMMFMSSDQNRCPVINYQLSSTQQTITPLTQKNGLNNVSLLKLNNFDFLSISPGKVENQFTFYLVALTKGGVKFFKRMQFQVIMNKGFNSLPFFIFKPQDIVIEGKIEDLFQETGDKIYLLKYTYFYHMTDLENDEVTFDYSYNAFMQFYKPVQGPFEGDGLKIEKNLIAFSFSVQAFVLQAKLYGNNINRNYEATFQLSDTTNKQNNQFNNYKINIIVNVDLQNLNNLDNDNLYFLQEPKNSCAQNGTISGYENLDLLCGETIGTKCKKVCTILEPELVLDKMQTQIKAGNLQPLLILSGQKMKMLKEQHEFLNEDTTDLMISNCLYKYTFYKIDIIYKTKENMEEKKCSYESNTVADGDFFSLFGKTDGQDIESSMEYQMCLVVKNNNENIECDGKTIEELEDIYLNFIQNGDNNMMPTQEFLSSIKDLQKQEKSLKIKEYFEIPMPKIIKVEYEHQTGYLLVHFDKQMLDEIIDERNLKLLDELKIKLSIMAKEDNSKFTSHKGTRVRNFLDVQQQKMQEQEAVAFILFSWEPVSYKNKVITLKMNFENYKNVSTSQKGWDKLEFIMLQQQKIQSNRFKVVSPESVNKPFIVHIPPQFTDSPVKTAINTLTKTAVLQSLATVILNIISGQSVQMLNSMQIVLHFGCMTIPVPGNVYYTNQQINQLLQVEFYPVEKIYPQIFNFSKKETLNPQFESMGYESGVLKEGLGSDFINLSIICISILVSTVLTKVAVCKFQKQAYRKLGVKIHNGAGNQFISRFAQLGYLEVTINVLISLKFSSFNDFSNISDFYSLIWTIFLGAIFITLPFYIFGKLWSNMGNLYDYNFKFNNGWIYEELSYLQYSKTSFYGAFYLRRLIYVVLLVYLRSYPCLQQQLHLFMSILFLVIIGMNKPFIYKLQNKIELFNEVCIILCTYCYFDFMNIAYTIDSRYTIGFVYIIILALNAFFNLILIIYKRLQKSKFLLIRMKRAKLYFKEKLEIFKLWCLIDQTKYLEKVNENLMKEKILKRKKHQEYLIEEQKWLNYHNLDFQQEVEEQLDVSKIEENKLKEEKLDADDETNVQIKEPIQATKSQKKLLKLKKITKSKRIQPSQLLNKSLDTIQEHPVTEYGDPEESNSKESNSEESNQEESDQTMDGKHINPIIKNARKKKNRRSKKMRIKSDEEYRKLYNAPKDTLLPFSLMTFKQNPINQKIEEEKLDDFSNQKYEPEKRYIINPITQEVEEFDEQKDYIQMKQQQQRQKRINYFALIDQKKLQANIDACLDP